MDASTINNLVVVSDIHAGCQMGLCPPEGVELDGGAIVSPTAFQLKMWSWWREFWDHFVPDATRGEPYTIVFNGDAIDGVHHNSTTQITHNLTDQRRIAKAILEPVAKLGRFFFVRGTEAHVGKSAQEEEGLAEDLQAKPNELKRFARYDLWIRVGPSLVHLLHHIGSTGSQAYEATAVHKELTESYVEAARWNREPPDVIVRSHRHKHIQTEIATAKGRGIAVVTPAWQGKTPFAWKIPGARLSEPQIGGIVIRHAHSRTFVDPFVRSFDRSPEEPNHA